MKSFSFSIRVYVKGTRITPFIMPRNGMYKCNWTPTGVCNFEGVDNGFIELFARLEDYFHMDEKIDDEETLIEYYDRTREDLRKIGSQGDFETALRHSSETYSPFSLVIKVNAKRRDEHWYNGESITHGPRSNRVAFERAWKISKPKFTCIRKWLISLEGEGKVIKDISESCSYGERAFLYSQFGKNGYKKLTNHEPAEIRMDQLNVPSRSLTSIKEAGRVELELVEPENQQQKMLQDKMMMDPVISLILFNEYIPLRAPKTSQSNSSSASAVCEKMSGLFLGKSEEPEKENVKASPSASLRNSVFIRSEPAEANKPTSSGGIFIRSVDQVDDDDWIIA